MALVNCNECQRLINSRSAQVCNECYAYLCDDCARANHGHCSDCDRDEEDWL